MQGFFSRLLCAAIGIMLTTTILPKANAQDAVVSYQTFYDELSPYGQWVGDPEYGNVWVPNVEPGFRPYATEGHWAMTEYGNMWVSEAPWGWAAYHYGRWTYNSYYGWIWAPAWVSWRQGGGYYGWAPMAPGYVPGRYYDYPDNYWVFVGPQYLYHPRVYSYYEPRNTTIYISHTTYINETYVEHSSNVTYCYGPRREVIERESHQRVEVYQVANASAPGATHISNNSVNIYRPAVNSQSENSARPANVITASRPIGKPEGYDPSHNHAEFQEQVHTQGAVQQQSPTHQPMHEQQPGRRGQFTQPTSEQRNETMPGRHGQFTQPQSQPTTEPRSVPAPGRHGQFSQPQSQPAQEQQNEPVTDHREPYHPQPMPGQQRDNTQHQQMPEQRPQMQQHAQPQMQRQPQPSQPRRTQPSEPSHEVKRR